MLLSLTKLCMFLIRKNRYTLLYLVMRKVVGPRLLHSPYYCALPFQAWWRRLSEPDYFYDSWEVVVI